MIKKRKKIKSCKDTKGGCFKQESEDELTKLTFEQRTGLVRKPNGLGERVERIAQPSGLGDRVESIAQPIARVIDRLAGTNIQGCGACQKRKEYLNEKFPNT